MLRRTRDQPELILPAALILGFVIWGHEGVPAWLDPAWFSSPAGYGIASFFVGFLALVALPGMLLRFWCRENLSEYGLGLGDWRKGLAAVALIGGGSIPIMYFVARQPEIQSTYPLFDPGNSLWAYEASYLLFFAALEVSARGYLLFGVRRWTQSTPLALLISTLLQAVWHLDKPIAEMIAAPLWGLAVGALCLRLRSVWYAVLFHFVSNVALDLWVISSQ